MNYLRFDLWVSASQMTDIVYIASDGGRSILLPQVLERLRLLRTFINVVPVDGADIDAMLSTNWKDPEDALLFQLALRLQTDAIITRDADFPATKYINVFDCAEFFEWLKTERGITYEEVPF